MTLELELIRNDSAQANSNSSMGGSKQRYRLNDTTVWGREGGRTRNDNKRGRQILEWSCLLFQHSHSLKWNGKPSGIWISPPGGISSTTVGANKGPPPSIMANSLLTGVLGCWAQMGTEITHTRWMKKWRMDGVRVPIIHIHPFGLVGSPWPEDKLVIGLCLLLAYSLTYWTGS